jgi:hypothetical protein
MVSRAWIRTHLLNEPDWLMKLHALIRMVPDGKIKNWLLDRWCDLERRRR